MQVKYIVLHHSAVSRKDNQNQFDAIRKGHIEKGYGNIGYNWLIEPSGDLKEGRKQDKPGAHCYGRNHDSLGICIAGNFSKEYPTILQEDSLFILLNTLTKQYPNAKIMHHRDFCNTQCPGNLLPKNWHKLINNNNNEMRLFIDRNKNQVLGDEELQFGYSIPNEKKLEEITRHCAKLGIELGKPEKKDMTGWYIISGTNASGWKKFLNI